MVDYSTKHKPPALLDYQVESQVGSPRRQVVAGIAHAPPIVVPSAVGTFLSPVGWAGHRRIKKRKRNICKF